MPILNNSAELPILNDMSETVILEHAGSINTDFLIYTGNFCGYCTAAKRLFVNKNLSYTEYNFDEHLGLRQQIVEATGHRTIPVIFDIRGNEVKFIGGFDEANHYLG